MCTVVCVVFSRNALETGSSSLRRIWIARCLKPCDRTVKSSLTSPFKWKKGGEVYFKVAGLQLLQGFRPIMVGKRRYDTLFSDLVLPPSVRGP